MICTITFDILITKLHTLINHIPFIQIETCNPSLSTCPSFNTGTSKLLIPFTMHRNQAPLTFTLSNHSPTNPLACLLTIFNGKFINKNITLPFNSLNSTHGQCQLTNVFHQLDPLIHTTGQVQTNLRLLNTQGDYFIDSSLNGRLALLFYKCEVKANDCGECLSLNRQFSCMWCNGGPLDTQVTDLTTSKSTCRFMNSQSKQAAASQCISAISTFFSSLGNKDSKIGFNQCDKPQITSISPTKLPIGGGTVLTITGVNLGSSLSDIDSVAIQCGSDTSQMSSQTLLGQVETISSETICDLESTKYIPSKEIVCVTRPSTSGAHLNCKLLLKLKSRLIIDKHDVHMSLDPKSSIMNILITNNQIIEYTDPQITDVQPATVIQSANFVWLTLKVKFFHQIK